MPSADAFAAFNAAYPERWRIQVRRAARELWVTCGGEQPRPGELISPNATTEG